MRTKQESASDRGIFLYRFIDLYVEIKRCNNVCNSSDENRCEQKIRPIDIRNIGADINSVVETHRIENIFPYDAYQNIPEGIYLGLVDKSRGVVVGYTDQ